MKVKELLEQLKSYDPEFDVIIQIDEEGNGYIPVRGIDSDCMYYEGECYGAQDEEYVNEFEDMGFKPNCIVVYP